jgi:hypothetical protein
MAGAGLGGDEGDAVSAAAMGQRGARPCGGDLRGGHGGDDIAPEIPIGQELGFFAEVPIDAGIAAVQAHHEVAAFGFVQHGAVNVELRGGGTAAGFAHRDQPGFQAGQHVVGNQPVVQDHIRFVQIGHRAPGQQGGIRRTAHQRDEAGVTAHIQGAEPFNQVVAIRADDQGEASLLGHGFKRQIGGDAVREPEPLQCAGGDDQGVVVAGVQLRQALMDGAAQGFQDDARDVFTEFGFAARAAGADAAHVGFGKAFAHHEGLADVARGEQRGDGQSGHGDLGQILGGVDGEVGGAFQQGAIQVAGEKILGHTGISQRYVLIAVARRGGGVNDQRGVGGQDSEQQGADFFHLGQGQRALPGGDG